MPCPQPSFLPHQASPSRHSCASMLTNRDSVQAESRVDLSRDTHLHAGNSEQISTKNIPLSPATRGLTRAAREGSTPLASATGIRNLRAQAASCIPSRGDGEARPGDPYGKPLRRLYKVLECDARLGGHWLGFAQLVSSKTRFRSFCLEGDAWSFFQG